MLVEKQARSQKLTTAQVLATLLNGVAADQVGLGHAAQGAAAGAAAGNAAALLAVAGGAGVLLERGVGDAALAAGGRPAGVLAAQDDGVAGDVADALDVGDGGRGDGDEAENGGEGELHLDGGEGERGREGLSS